jgi:hypothetical protein
MYPRLISDGQIRWLAAIGCLAALAWAGGASQARADFVTGVTTTNTLVTFDSATPGTIVTAVGVTGMQSGETLLGIDFRPATGGLYGLGSTSRLYQINPTTGAATQVGSAGAFTLSGTSFGFDFNPTVDRIRVTGNTGQDLRLNPNDGTLTATDTPLNFAAGDPNAGATPRVVGSAYSNNTAGASSTTLYDIDSNLDILVTQNPPNNGTLNTVGPLGFNTADLVGFDIQGGSGIAYASLTPPTGGASQLFTINLNTGAATLVGTIGSGSTLTALAVGPAATNPVPEPGALRSALLGGFLIMMGLSRIGKDRRIARRRRE